MKPITIPDLILLAIALGLWIAVAWRGIVSRAIGELWWTCVCLAAIATLKIGVISDLFNMATGGVRLDVVTTNLAAVTAATLTVQWQVQVRYGSRTPWRLARPAGLAAILVTLGITWFLAPVYNIPITENWIPPTVLGHPAMALHWLLTYLYILAYVVVFLRIGYVEARGLPGNHIRLSLSLLLVGCVVLAVWASTGIVMQVREFLGLPFPSWLMFLANQLLVIFFVLFFAAVSIPPVQGGRQRHGRQETEQAVASLWTWMHTVGGQSNSMVTVDPQRTGSLDQMIEIRHRLGMLQRWVSPEDLAREGHSARREGLFGRAARAAITARCLHKAAAAAAAGAPPAERPADLGQLGGGRSERQEARWLAEVSQALFAVLPQTTSMQAGS